MIGAQRGPEVFTSSVAVEDVFASTMGVKKDSSRGSLSRGVDLISPVGRPSSALRRSLPFLKSVNPTSDSATGWLFDSKSNGSEEALFKSSRLVNILGFGRGEWMCDSIARGEPANARRRALFLEDSMLGKLSNCPVDLDAARDIGGVPEAWLPSDGCVLAERNERYEIASGLSLVHNSRGSIQKGKGLKLGDDAVNPNESVLPMLFMLVLLGGHGGLLSVMGKEFARFISANVKALLGNGARELIDEGRWCPSDNVFCGIVGNA
tara:strand:- start:31449 stop:32243 length:795 start_codon:yes stop_codon:yes gene_type:complete